MAGLCGRLGYRIPLPELTANETNPKGFGEPKWAVEFHDRLLRRLNVGPEDARPQAWDLTAEASQRTSPRLKLRAWLEEQFTESDHVVVKDPRLTWFLGMYDDAVDEVGATLTVVTMVRHPAASIKSRELAYGTSTGHAARTAGWLNVMLGTELRTRPLARAFVSYDRLLSDWEGAFAAIEDHAGRPLFSSAEAAKRTAGALIDPALRRAEPDWGDLGLPPAIQDLARRTHLALTTLVDDPRGGNPAELDALRVEYAELYSTAEAITTSTIRSARVAERRKTVKRLEAATQ